MFLKSTTTDRSESATGRRRHAAAGPNWVRRAGVVGGVAGVLALSGAAAPAMARPNGAPAQATPSATGRYSVLNTSAEARQAASSLDRTAFDLGLRARRAEAAERARKAAAAEQAAAVKAAAVKAAAVKAAAERAAEQRAAAAQTASRSAPRATLSVTTPAASSGSSSAAPSGSSSATAAPSASSSPSSSTSGGIASVIGFLKAQVGKSYAYGATGPSAYDCSGLTLAAFRTIGVELPRTSQAQSNAGTPVSVSSVRAGDLVFWGGQGSAYHVAVYIGDGRYLDAANPSKGVVIQQMSNYMPDFAARVA